MSSKQRALSPSVRACLRLWLLLGVLAASFASTPALAEPPRPGDGDARRETPTAALRQPTPPPERQPAAPGAGPQVTLPHIAADASCSGQVGYVLDTNVGLIHEICTVDQTVMGVIDTNQWDDHWSAGSGGRPMWGALSPDGDQLYVSQYYYADVLVINTADNTLDDVIALGPATVAYPDGKAGDVVFRADGAYAFVVYPDANSVVAIDTATHVTSTIPVAAYPTHLAYVPAAHKLYVSHRNNGATTVIDTETLQVLKTIPEMQGVAAFAVSPDQTRLYAAQVYEDGIQVFDPLTDQLVASWVVGAWSMPALAVTPDGRELYVTSGYGKTLVLDTATGRPVVLLDQPNGANVQTIETSQGGQAYVITHDYNSGGAPDMLSIIDTATHQVLKTLTPGANSLNGIVLAPVQQSAPQLTLSAPQQDVYGLPGQTITFTTRVYNMTGVSQDLTLDVAGGAWPCTIAPSTLGTLADKENLPITVTMRLPANAPLASTDSLTFTISAGAQRLDARFTGHTARFGYAMSTLIGVQLLDLATHTSAGAIDDTKWHAEEGNLTPDGRQLWTCSSNEHAFVYDAATQSLLKEFYLDGGLCSIAFSPDSAFAFIGLMELQEVVVIDTTRFEEIKRIQVGNVTDLAAGLDFKVYAANSRAKSISVIDARSFSVIQTLSGPSEIYRIAVGPSGDRLYAADNESGDIHAIELATGAVVWTYNAGIEDFYGKLVVSHDGRKLYASDYYQNRVVVVNTDDGTLAAAVPVTRPQDVQILPPDAGNLAYIAADMNGPSAIMILNMTNDTVSGTIPLPGGAYNLALTPRALMQGGAVHVTFPTEQQIAKPGKPTVYSGRVYNSTGGARRFSLELNGGSWAAQLSSADTGLLAPGASYGFTVTMQTPADAPVGAANQARVTVTGDGFSANAVVRATVAKLGYILDGDDIIPFDTTTNTRMGANLKLGYFRNGALTPDGKYLYALAGGDDKVVVIDTSDHSIVHTYDVTSPADITFSSDGAYAFVARSGPSSSENGYVSVIDTARQTAVVTLTVGLEPEGIVAAPAAGKVYVANSGSFSHVSTSVSVIDMATFTVVKTISGFSMPQAVVAAPDGKRVYVINRGLSTGSGAGSVSVIDTSSDTVSDSWFLRGSWFSGADVSPDGKTLYVAATDDSALYVVNTETGAHSTIDLDARVTNVQVSPDASYIYVSASDLLSILNTATQQVATISGLGYNLYGLALFPRVQPPVYKLWLPMLDKP